MTCPQGQTSRQPDLPAAWHALLEIDGADPGALADPAFAEQTLRRACLLAGATILHGYFHKFGGAGGVTGFLALSESHASIHTWPEFGRACVDVFMCGAADARAACDAIASAYRGRSGACRMAMVRRLGPCCGELPTEVCAPAA